MIEPNNSTAVQTLLLQQHAALLTRSIVIPIVGRILLFAFLIILAIKSEIEPLYAAALVLPACMTTFAWLLEERLTRYRIYQVEQVITIRAGGDWEDIFIKSRYQNHSTSSYASFLRLEPLVWFMMITVVCLLSSVDMHHAIHQSRIPIPSPTSSPSMMPSGPR